MLKAKLILDPTQVSKLELDEMNFPRLIVFRHQVSFGLGVGEKAGTCQSAID